MVHYLTRTGKFNKWRLIEIFDYICIQVDTVFLFFIEKTTEFDKWIIKLKDLKSKSIILFKIQKLESDEHFGDCKPVGDGIREMRVNFGSGYRVYFKEKDGKIIVLLIGGNKSSQQKDILKAKEIWKQLNK